jgi:hypothetical protein
LKNALFNAAASSPNTSPLDFMLGLMGDPKVPTDLRLDMAVAAAPFVHAKPQAPPRVRTNPMDSSPIKGVPDSIEPNSDAASPKQDTRRPKMEAELKGPELALGNGLSENGAGDNGVDSTPLQIMLGVTNVAGAAATQRNPMDSNPVKGVPGSKTEEELKAPELARADGLSENGAGDNGVDLTPLQFMLSVMQDADATPKLRIKAARVAARYKHAAVPSDKLAAVDEYGFAISRTLANAIKEDWLALRDPRPADEAGGIASLPGGLFAGVGSGAFRRVKTTLAATQVRHGGGDRACLCHRAHYRLRGGVQPYPRGTNPSPHGRSQEQEGDGKSGKESSVGANPG